MANHVTFFELVFAVSGWLLFNIKKLATSLWGYE